MVNYPSKEKLEEEEAQGMKHGSRYSDKHERICPSEPRYYNLDEVSGENLEPYKDSAEDIMSQQMHDLKKIKKGQYRTMMR